MSDVGGAARGRHEPPRDSVVAGTPEPADRTGERIRHVARQEPSVSTDQILARADVRRVANRKVPVTLFGLLLVFWVILSDQHTPLFLGLGVASSALVTWLCAPMVDDVVGIVPHPLRSLPTQLWRFIEYLVWVLWRVLASAVQVAVIVVNPRAHPEPRMLRFRTNLESGLARVVLANTISLVPGTLTVAKDGPELLVHALTPEAVEDLLDGRMQTRIARIFFEEPEQAIDPRWEEPPSLFPRARPDGGDR